MHVGLDLTAAVSHHVEERVGDGVAVVGRRRRWGSTRARPGARPSSTMRWTDGEEPQRDGVGQGVVRPRGEDLGARAAALEVVGHRLEDPAVQRGAASGAGSRLLEHGPRRASAGPRRAGSIARIGHPARRTGQTETDSATPLKLRRRARPKSMPGRSPDRRPHLGGGQDLAALGRVGDPGGDVDGVADEVVAHDHGLAVVDAGPEAELAAVGLADLERGQDARPRACRS